MRPGVFCEIVGGRGEQEIVHSNADVLAFLCDPPATWGHTLVVPRAYRRDIWTSSRRRRPPRSGWPSGSPACRLRLGPTALGAAGRRRRRATAGHREAPRGPERLGSRPWRR